MKAALKKTGLRIKRIETFTQGTTLSVVKLTTDDGSQGTGQISTYDADIAATVLHRKLAHLVLGSDPGDLDAINDRCIERNYKYPWSYVNRALAGIDTAIWDLRGRQAGVPVTTLLGGSPGRLRAYASSMKRDITPKDEAARLTRLRDEQGFDAFKVRLGAEVGRDQDEWPGRTEAIVPAVRAAVAVGEVGVHQVVLSSAAPAGEDQRGVVASPDADLGGGAAVAELLQDMRQLRARRRREERAVLPIAALAQPHAVEPAEPRARIATGLTLPRAEDRERALEHSRGRRERALRGPTRSGRQVHARRDLRLAESLVGQARTCVGDKQRTVCNL